MSLKLTKIAPCASSSVSCTEVRWIEPRLELPTDSGLRQEPQIITVMVKQPAQGLLIASPSARSALREVQGRSARLYPVRRGKQLAVTRPKMILARASLRRQFLGGKIDHLRRDSFPANSPLVKETVQSGLLCPPAASDQWPGRFLTTDRKGTIRYVNVLQAAGRNGRRSAALAAGHPLIGERGEQSSCRWCWRRWKIV